MDQWECDHRELKDSRRKVRIVKNGEPQVMAFSVLKQHIQFEDLALAVCNGFEINTSEAGSVRVFKAGGVEIFNEDVQYIKDGDILFASFGEDFDESSNFALYKMIRSLGEGGYGKVFEAKNRLTKEKVAIKLIDCSKIYTFQENAKETEMIYKELIALKGLNHRSILKVFNCFTLKKEMKVALIFEYLSGGDLREYMEQKKILTEKEGQKLFQQLFQAIQYCHKESIIHRDLKLENIMFEDKDHDKLKVVDFGISGRQSLINIDFTEAGSLRYIAPEVISSHSPAVPSIDIWAMGCILFWMLTGGSPFPQKTKEAVQESILSGRWKFSLENKQKLTKSVQNLISSMLIVDVKKRIKMGDIAEHPWTKKRIEEMQNICSCGIQQNSSQLIEDEQNEQLIEKNVEENDFLVVKSVRKKDNKRSKSPQVKNVNGTLIPCPNTPSKIHHKPSNDNNSQIQGSPRFSFGNNQVPQNHYYPPNTQQHNENRLILPKIDQNRRSSIEPNYQLQFIKPLSSQIFDENNGFTNNFQKNQLPRGNSPMIIHRNHFRFSNIQQKSPSTLSSSGANFVATHQKKVVQNSSSQRQKSPPKSIPFTSFERSQTEQDSYFSDQILKRENNKSRTQARSSFYEQRSNRNIQNQGINYQFQLFKE